VTGSSFRTWKEMEATTKTLEVPSLVDALYAATRDRILNGELPAGDPVTEVDLATLYSVARPTAKAAMERLVYDGLLRRAWNKTARVPIMTSEDIRDLYFVRAFLEREIGMELAKRKLVPEAARRSLQAMRECGPDSPVTQVVEADIEFHLALVEALASPRLGRLYRSLMGEVHLCMAQVRTNQLESPASFVDEHLAIIDAIEVGEPHYVSQLISNHLEAACLRLLRHVAGHEADTDTETRAT
jgi:DNA-binding GntR family transcriptional regulator